MAVPKYKKQFQSMLEDNKALFDQFKKVHDNFEANPEKYKQEFSELRQQVLRIIKRNEDRLCAKSENTKFSVYSQTLADKFWEEVRANFPKIDSPVLES